MTAPTFESAIAQLEAILRELESDATTLDDALARYESGVALLKQCYAQLKTAELKVRQLTGVADDGSLELAPFEHQSAVSRAPRRKAAAASE
jgi:exodeoxyribonuclease VII small subunit